MLDGVYYRHQCPDKKKKERQGAEVVVSRREGRKWRKGEEGAKDDINLLIRIPPCVAGFSFLVFQGFLSVALSGHERQET